ncbi:hypothetical protein BH23GEM3_BH23GEM3_15110 [soil metagenome]
MAKPSPSRTIEALRHEEATRRNIPTVEYQAGGAAESGRRTWASIDRYTKHAFV